MAKRSEGQTVLEMVVTDVRLRRAPLATRILWQAVMLEMIKLGVAVLRFGQQVPCADLLSDLAAIPVSEVAGAIDYLVAFGLLKREADGALASPARAAAAARSEINRQNALAGVRKRQGKVVEGQRTLPMMGVVAGSEHPAKASDAAPAAPPLSLSLKEQKPKPKLTVDDATFHRVGQAAFTAAGFDMVRDTPNYGIVRQWLADGLTEEVILGTIETVMARGSRPGHLGFFKPAMLKAREQMPVSHEADPAWFAQCEAARQAWIEGGKQGPAPTRADFEGREHAA